ncbi:MAG: hypothetical protein ABF250_07590 [Polaribacter sp.]|uniref:hypothetical protein n=1 Tax=Polaribacter sp. TaxID=1920175 RepID=UPI002610EBC2|nr:hypothetical protein [uncultured Polaribacter sp.]
MKIEALIASIFFISVFSFAQENNTQKNTLNRQFNEIYKTSNSYQTYKVISKNKFLELNQNVLDSLKELKNSIVEKNKQLSEKGNTIKTTQENLTSIQIALHKAKEKENSISLFGLQLNKLTYNLILWSIILGLLLALLYYIFRFNRSNILTKKAQSSLLDVEHEFDKHRKKFLEREQKLRRQLQDEINKQRNI